MHLPQNKPAKKKADADLSFNNFRVSHCLVHSNLDYLELKEN